MKLNPKRLVRDLAIVLLCCGLFFATTFLIGNLHGDEAQTNDEVFSQPRLLADQQYENESWEDAAKNWKEILADDPYNGYAKYHLAFCYDRLRQRSQKRSSDSFTKDLPADEVARLESEHQRYLELALQTLNDSQKHLRFRVRAQHLLASIYCDIGEYDKALANLAEFINDGNWYRNGMEAMPQFGSGGPEVVGAEPIDPIKDDTIRLHRFKKFWELVDIEAETRRQMWQNSSFPGVNPTAN